MENKFNEIQGKLLACGDNRCVYQHRENPNLVIKYSRNSDMSNQTEWKLWSHLKDSEWSRYLCPCISIHSGILVMMKCQTPRRLPRKYWIDKVMEQEKDFNHFLGFIGEPLLNTENCFHNFGFLNDQLVQFDYENRGMLLKLLGEEPNRDNREGQIGYRNGDGSNVCKNCLFASYREDLNFCNHPAVNFNFNSPFYIAMGHRCNRFRAFARNQATVF